MGPGEPCDGSDTAGRGNAALADAVAVRKSRGREQQNCDPAMRRPRPAGERSPRSRSARVEGEQASRGNAARGLRGLAVGGAFAVRSPGHRERNRRRNRLRRARRKGRKASAKKEALEPPGIAIAEPPPAAQGWQGQPAEPQGSCTPTGGAAPTGRHRRVAPGAPPRAGRPEPGGPAEDAVPPPPPAGDQVEEAASTASAGGDAAGDDAARDTAGDVGGVVGGDVRGDAGPGLDATAPPFVPAATEVSAAQPHEGGRKAPPAPEGAAAAPEGAAERAVEDRSGVSAPADQGSGVEGSPQTHLSSTAPQKTSECGRGGEVLPGSHFRRERQKLHAGAAAAGAAAAGAPAAGAVAAADAAARTAAARATAAGAAAAHVTAAVAAATGGAAAATPPAAWSARRGPTGRHYG